MVYSISLWMQYSVPGYVKTRGPIHDFYLYRVPYHVLELNSLPRPVVEDFAYGLVKQIREVAYFEGLRSLI